MTQSLEWHDEAINQLFRSILKKLLKNI